MFMLILVSSLGLIFYIAQVRIYLQSFFSVLVTAPPYITHATLAGASNDTCSPVVPMHPPLVRASPMHLPNSDASASISHLRRTRPSHLHSPVRTINSPRSCPNQPHPIQPSLQFTCTHAQPNRAQSSRAQSTEPNPAEPQSAHAPKPPSQPPSQSPSRLPRRPASHPATIPPSHLAT